LKVFLDLLPQFALAGKAILPIATGGSVAHLPALDYGLGPVLQSMGAQIAHQNLKPSHADVWRCWLRSQP
jgi:FMN reductase